MMNETDVATLRRQNETMIERIRAMPRQPYQDGQYALRVAAVPGRVTARKRTWPIAVPQVAGQRYLCTPNPGNDWARNVAAAGFCWIEDDDNVYRAKRVTDGRAPTVVATYLKALGYDSPQAAGWPFPPDADENTIRNHLDEIAVFHLRPHTEEG